MYTIPRGLQKLKLNLAYRSVYPLRLLSVWFVMSTYKNAYKTNSLILETKHAKPDFSSLLDLVLSAKFIIFEVFSHVWTAV